jgi:DNA-nicking Smr family endonuclease
MPRRGRRPAAKPTTPEQGGRRPRALNAPFADLGKRLRPVTAPSPPPPVASKSVPVDEPNVFASAMEGVVPLAGSRARVDPPRPAGGPRPPVSEEAEALAALSELVNGGAGFDVSDTREYVEGAIVGLDPRLLRRLRRGDFSWQTYLDLHGLTADEARPAVDRFLAEAVRAGHRCVLLVHGRGRNSKDQTPVLKERLKVWLARGASARIVLAFATARPCDGGAGALYVLLRRDRRRRPIQVTEGAKR